MILLLSGIFSPDSKGDLKPIGAHKPLASDVRKSALIFEDVTPLSIHTHM